MAALITAPLRKYIVDVVQPAGTAPVLWQETSNGSCSAADTIACRLSFAWQPYAEAQAAASTTEPIWVGRWLIASHGSSPEAPIAWRSGPRFKWTDWSPASDELVAEWLWVNRRLTVALATEDAAGMA